MIVRFLVPAQIEVDEIIVYYNQKRPGLGQEFAAELQKTLLRIQHYPHAWFPLSSRVRRCQLSRFPYSVIYEVREDLILIAAIQHHHQRPNRWRERLV